MKNRLHAIRNVLIGEGLYRPDSASVEGNDLWRIAVEPFRISREELDFLERLGNQLLAFYQALNRLYLDSVHGKAPAWVAGYLDQGKPDAVIEYGRMNRFKQELPGIIRPDLIPTEEGMIATELDSVPGGFGLTAALSEVYAAQGARPIGSQDRTQGGTLHVLHAAGGMAAGFERMIRSLAPGPDVTLAIVVSEESKYYRPEMEWLGRTLGRRGLRTYVLPPQEVLFTEEGLWVEAEGKKEKIDILYRFFELFDLKNIPKSELILYAAKKKRVVLTPPPKAQLEEKSAFALFHHPALKPFWLRQLGGEIYAILENLFPKSWIIDPRPIPPHGVIPDLMMGDRPVTDFRRLGEATQKERRWVIKPSGFSELAWGSRGVAVGHDLPEEAWRAVIDRALESFPTTPYILQKFRKGKKVTVEYYDFEKEASVPMEGRARLSPYYFVEGKEAKLGGILATVCSLEKKLIHGMVDAVMAPCAVAASSPIGRESRHA
ncbi:MAG TPA: hypothetical protein VI382_10370 [Candidatus Manganitrophaceae bacterium]|nr:hypothetical protein [Candidatus Manganitrophaceae bacterium]